MTPYGLPLWIVLLFLFVLGTVLGSFLNVCIHRIPKHDRLVDQIRGLLHPPSTCPGCGTPILVRDNVPILGWLLLRGRCRACRRRISWRYPAVELLNGLLFVGVYLLEVPAARSDVAASCLSTALGPAVSGWTRDAVWFFNLRYLYHMVLIEFLVAATFIDFDLRIIPDATTVPAMVVGVLGGLISGRLYLVPVWFQDSHLLGAMQPALPASLGPLLEGPAVPEWIAGFPHLHGLAVSAAGFVVGGGIVWAVRAIGSRVLRREAMGFGDVMLMAMIGSFLGWQPTLVAFFVAPVMALAVVGVRSVVHRQSEIAYGPYLSLGAVVVLLGWKHVFPATRRIFDLGPLVPVVFLWMAILLVASLYLVRGVKRALGFKDAPQGEWEDVWRSADQLQFVAGETVDPQQGRWRTESWPGTAAGQGRIHEERWRRPGR